MSLKNNDDSIEKMLIAMKEFQDKHGFKEQGKNNPHSRITYLTEELGEIAECISKGKPHKDLAEEHADLLIVLLGNCLCFDINIVEAFWKKHEIIMNRPSKIVDGLVRLDKEEKCNCKCNTEFNYIKEDLEIYLKKIGLWKE